MILGFERCLNSLSQLHHLLQCRGLETGEIADMRVGSDHYMPGGIRIQIHQDKIQATAVQDQAFAIMRWVA